MTRHARIFTVLAAAAALTIVVPSRDAYGQTGTVTTETAANLGFKSAGEPQGYAFLKQSLPSGRQPGLTVHLRPESTIGSPDAWTWKVTDSDNELKWALNFTWYGQASCPDNLTNLQVSGPGGLLVQNPLSNPIWGTFKTQSFTLTTVKDVCVNWANANACDPSVPSCAEYETFDLVGGVNPAGPSDRLRLKASCTSGPVADTFYAPVMRLRCDRGSLQ